MKEKLGALITKNQFFIDLGKKAEEAFIRWGEKIDENSTQLKAWASDGATAIIKNIVTILSYGKDFYEFFSKNGTIIKSTTVEMVKLWAISKAVAGMTAVITFFQGMSVATAALAAKTLLLNTAMKASLPILAAYAGYKIGEIINDKISGYSRIIKETEQSRSQLERLQAELNARLAGGETLDTPSKSGAEEIARQGLANQIKQMTAAAEADKQILQNRLKEHTKFYDSLAEKIKENAELEKKHVQELTELYRQKADVQKSAESLILGLQQASMTPEQRYQSQRDALENQYYEAVALSGQEQVKALEAYKQAMASFASTYQNGVKDANNNLLVESSAVVQTAIDNIRFATAEQEKTLTGLALEKQKQIEADREWGNSLVSTANDVQAQIQSLKDTIAGLSGLIDTMSNSVDITAVDRATSVVQNIKSQVDQLHDKTITITTVTRSVSSSSSGASSGTKTKGSYRYGTSYVPATGPYQLHQGEKVITAGGGASNSGFSGDIIFQIPESASPQKTEDWLDITRTYIIPELEKING